MLNPAIIIRDSWRYSLLRLYLLFCHNRLFYRKVVVKNFPTDLPKNTPLVIVANHQNTLMDALAILFNIGSIQPVFLTRADVFKRPLFKKILTSLKMLPVYRQHDEGGQIQQKNDVIFDQCVELLQQKRTLAVFPEGNHGVEYKLRPLKKGTARIALKAESESNWNLNLNILPCGLHYTDCRKLGEVLTLNFGQPFGIQFLKNEFEENSSRACSTLTQTIAERLKQLMYEIEYESKLQLNRKGTKFNRWRIPMNSIWPVAFFGYVANFIPFALPFLITRKLKDKQFSNAIRFVAYFLITFPLYYLLVLAILLYFFSAFMAFGILLLVVIGGLVALLFNRKIPNLFPSPYILYHKL